MTQPTPPNLAELLDQGLALMQGNAPDRATEFFRQAAGLAPLEPWPWFYLGLCLFQTGLAQEGTEHLVRAQALAPEDGRINLALGQALSGQGQPARALPFLQKAAQANPPLTQAWGQAAQILVELDRWDEAAQWLGQAVRQAPDQAGLWLNLGEVLAHQGIYFEARAALERCQELEPRNAAALHLLSYLNLHLQQAERALQYSRQAIELEPESPQMRIQMGFILLSMGQRDQALPHYRAAVQYSGGSPRSYYSLAMAPKGALTEEDRANLQGQLQRGGLDDKDAILAHYALGRSLEQEEQFDLAFHHYLRANALQKRRHLFDSEEYAGMAREIMDTLGPEAFDQGQAELPGPSPIFIMSLPRAGSTLVERILGSHSRVTPCGELPFFSALQRRQAAMGDPASAYPALAARLTPEEARGMAEGYRQMVAGMFGQAGINTDKEPNNLILAGLVTKVFPSAKLILLQRDALDNCLSIFFHRLPLSSYPYASGLKDVAVAYREQARLIEHWKKVLPRSVYHLRYEDLVDQQEEQTRRLLDFCGLPFEPACLEFHRQSQTVLTMSANQVRKGINRDSLARWKNYAKYLKPVMRELSLPA